MIRTKDRIKVHIASKQYLIRIGVRALISHLGIEPEYVEAKQLEDILYGATSERNDYLILHHKLLEKPKANYFNTILRDFKGNVLLIGDDKMEHNFHDHIILPTDSETETLEKLQNFFYGITGDEPEEDNRILSAREIDILKEVAQGYSNKEIADRLFISINTVITHRKNLTEKLGIKTISGLTVYALMNNLINPEDVTI